MGHAGYIAGFRSVLNYAPEFDTVVVMLYNHDAADPEQSLADVLNPALPLLSASIENYHAYRGDILYRGILALGRNMGLDHTIA
jgi:hypothetical protein